jgi:hypothetical protein
VKLQADLLDTSYNLVELLWATPSCSADFCDSCNECLACWGGVPCYYGEGSHIWAVHAEDIPSWREQHPDATTEAPR